MKWYYEYFTDVDSKDVQKFDRWLTDDASFCFGNGPAVTGKEEIKAYVSNFLKMFDSLTHVHGSLVSQGNITVGEAKVIYRLHDGREIPALAATVIERRGDLICRLHAYLDLSPVFAALAEGTAAS